MATAKDGSLLNGLSGKIGDLVCRTYNGKTVVSVVPDVKRSKPKARKTAAPQTSQDYTRSRFAEASAFAKKQLEDPDKKEYYERKAEALNLPNAYTVALTHYLRRPKITEIECTTTTRSCVMNFRATRKDFGIINIDVRTIDQAQVITLATFKAINHNADFWNVKIPLANMKMAEGLSLAITHDTGELWLEGLSVAKNGKNFRVNKPRGRGKKRKLPTPPGSGCSAA